MQNNPARDFNLKFSLGVVEPVSFRSQCTQVVLFPVVHGSASSVLNNFQAEIIKCIVSKVKNNFAHLLIVLFFLFGCKLLIHCLFINSKWDYSS